MSAFSTLDSTVNSFYLAFYGRPADPAGLAFWSRQLADNNGDLTAIVPSFANSEEAQVRFGTDTLTSRIGEIYKQLFNHTPDAAGLAYWTSAVEQGNASLADVSIAILKVAQGTDESLSKLRQQAADAFTASVDASGTAYSGYAAIEAARVLVRAVTAGATATDLDVLVKAAVSFADTATKTPQVVEAIATGSTLLGLFDTTRGMADPVALAQALADTAKAAAGDPVTLASLLRGGGMAQVLKVMPAAATLQDVVKALAEGGLPAAVEVVYPTAPVVKPTPAMKLHFEGVTQGNDDHVTDNVTNVQYADVTFKYDGSTLAASQHFEYSLNGVNWSTAGLTVAAETNTVTIAHVNLGAASLPALTASSTLLQGPLLAPASQTINLQLRAVQGTNVIAAITQAIVYDGAPPTEVIGFASIGSGTPGDNKTTEENPGINFTLAGGNGDGIVEWRVQGDNAWTVLDSSDIGSDGAFTISGIDLSLSDPTIELRVIDAAGNVGMSLSQSIDGPYKPAAVISQVTNFGFAMTGNPSLVMLNSAPDPIIHATGDGASASGLLSTASLQLFDMRDGTEKATVTDYLDGELFNVFAGGGVRFDTTLPLGLYKLAWGNGTFATANGSLAEGELLFAGGVKGQLIQEGFALDHVAALNADIELDSEDLVGIAYLHDGLAQRKLITGDAQDVIIDNGGALDIGFRYFRSGAQDLVLGFDSGSDVISLHGKAASAVDTNNDGQINWVTSSAANVKAVVTGTTEAVSIVYSGTISTGTSAWSTNATLSALNYGIDLTAMAADAELLILAKTGAGNGGALLHFRDMDGNSQIDNGELTLFASFDGGVPVTTDVVLVGTQDNTEIAPPP